MIILSGGGIGGSLYACAALIGVKANSTAKVIAASIASVLSFSCSLNSFFKAPPFFEICNQYIKNKKNGQVIFC